MVKKSFKERLESLKTMPFKKRMIIVGILIVLIIAITVLCRTVTANANKNYYHMLDKVFSERVGNFKYTVEVDSAKHGATAESDDATIAESSGATEASTIDGEAESTVSEDKAKHSDAVSTTWGNASGTEAVDWSYPCYQITVEGKTSSVDPLTSTADITIATPYVNEKLCTATVIDGKCYIDLQSARKWLLASTDANLVALAKDIPENAVYLVVDENEVHFYSQYAEKSEFEVSGSTNPNEMYNRFLVLEETVTDQLHGALGKEGLSSSNDKYMLNIDGDASLDVFSLMKNDLNNAGSLYSTYVKNLSKNKLMTDDQMSQAVRERDNFLSSISDKWIWLNSASTSDLKNMNLVINGVSDSFVTETNETAYEATMNMSFTNVKTNTDYTVKFSGTHEPFKDEDSASIAVPTKSALSYKDIKANSNLLDVRDNLIYYFDTFGLMKETRLDASSDLVVSNMLDDFITYANNKNVGNDKWVRLTKYNVTDFIKQYSDDKESGTDNYNLVKELLTSINTITGNSKVVEKVKTEAEVEEFREVKADTTSKAEDGTTADYSIIANVNKDECTSTLVAVDAIIMNKSDKDAIINLSSLSLQDMQNNKYPANYEATLHEYDNGFDMTKAPSTVTVTGNGYTTVKLYFVINNGMQYYDLFNGDTKLGDIIAY